MIQYVKRLFLLTLMLLGMSVAVGQSVTVWTVDNLPMVHLQDARRYVCDPDGLLSVAARDSADRMLARLEHTDKRHRKRGGHREASGRWRLL
mgnify:CR=1 FL=1